MVDQGGPYGLVEFRDSLLQNSKSVGLAGFDKAAYSALYLFTRTTWRGASSYPIYLSGTGGKSPEYGGVHWADSVIYHDKKGPWLSAADGANSIGCANLKGNLTVFNPSGATTGISAKGHDNVLKVVEHRDPIPSAVSVSASGRDFTFTRTSLDLSFPLAMAYDVGGSAVNRFDYAGLSGLVVIPPGEGSAVVRVHPRKTAGGKTATLSIPESRYYSVTDAGSATMRF